MLCEREIARKDQRRIEMMLRPPTVPVPPRSCRVQLRGSALYRPWPDPRPCHRALHRQWRGRAAPRATPGVGKTHLAVAIVPGYTMLFVPADPGRNVSQGPCNGAAGGKTCPLPKPKLLIVDELGCLPFEPDAAHLLFHLVSRRYEPGVLLVTSNRAVGEWSTVFGDPVVATAILDRMLHYSHVVTIRDEVISPFLRGLGRRIYAANLSFWAGGIPPLPMLGRSLL